MNRTSNPSSFLSFMADKVRTASSFNCSRGQSQATMPTYASIISSKFEATQKKKITNGPMREKFRNGPMSDNCCTDLCKSTFGHP
jgi:hypothetical protein